MTSTKLKQYARLALNIVTGTVTLYAMLAVAIIIAFIGIPLAAVGQSVYNLNHIKRGQQA